MSDFVINNGILKKYTGTGGDVVIPNGVTEIGNGAFYCCKSLTSVTIPDGATSIGNWAFYGCKSLTNITIPDSVKSIRKMAFYETPWLENQKGFVIVGNGILCKYNGEDSSVIIPGSVTNIGDEAFNSCESLTSITIPDGVTSIGDNAFGYCTSLKSIIIPDSVMSIEFGAFCSCESLTSITIPDGVTSIGDMAFYGCKSLTNITIPDSVKNIRKMVFDKTPWLENQKGFVIVGNGILYKYNGRDTTVTIPDGVTRIADDAFSGCTSLSSITIPDSVTSIGSSAFDETPWLENQKGLVIVGNGILYKYNGDDTNITIPDGVTSIEFSAFEDCTSLTNIIIPDSVTSIGSRAFSGCTSLKSIIIPDSVTSIGDWTFEDCTSLTNITIPESVNSIRDDAFYGCSSLHKVTNLSKVSMTVFLPKSSVVSDGCMPNEDIDNLPSQFKTSAALCYIGSEDKYSDELKIKYEAFIQKQNTRLFKKVVGINNVAKAKALLSHGYTKPDVLKKAIEESNDNVEMKAMLLEYQKEHVDLEKEL